MSSPKPSEPVGPMRLPASYNKTYSDKLRSERNRQIGMTKKTLWQRKDYTWRVLQGSKR